MIKNFSLFENENVENNSFTFVPNQLWTEINRKVIKPGDIEKYGRNKVWHIIRDAWLKDIRNKIQKGKYVKFSYVYSEVPRGKVEGYVYEVSNNLNTTIWIRLLDHTEMKRLNTFTNNYYKDYTEYQIDQSKEVTVYDYKPGTKFNKFDPYGEEKWEDD